MMPRLRLVLACLVVCTLPHLQTRLHAVDKTWDNGGPNDFWDEDDNWDPDEKPQPADKAIVGGNPEVNTLEIFGELENTGTIDITTGTLQPQANTMNNGTIYIGDGSAILSELNLGNSTTISGTGEVVLRNSDNLVGSKAVIRGGFTAPGAVTNAVGHIVRGEGNVVQHWINEGVFRAEETTGDSSAVLRLDNTTFTNNGELRSASGATITLSGADYSQGASGQLIADTDNITFAGSTFVSGGSLETVAGGVFISDGLVRLSGVTVNAPIDNTNTGGDGRLYSDAGGLTNNSTITLDGQSGNNSQFGFTVAPGTLDGTGELVLVGGNNNTFIGVFPGSPEEITHGANHTIRGAGVIASPIVNNGTIRAEPGTSGSILLVNWTQTNNGLMEAGAGATLEFQSNTSDTVQGATGVISAANGGTVEFENTDITGGSLATTGSGVIVVTANTTTLTDVTNLGTLNVPHGISPHLNGTSFTNDGLVTINSTGLNGFSQLFFDADVLLDGSGEIFLNEPSTNFPSFIRPDGNTVTQDVNHTIRGRGQILGTGTFVNNGRIEGDSAADPVRIRTRLEGTGTLENVSINFDSSGTVHAPGNSVGSVPLEGSYAITHPLARLEIEVGGLTPGTEHDELNSTGTVALNGTLDVLFVDLGNSYVPDAGDRFEIITSPNNDITGTFASANFPELGGGRGLEWSAIDYSDPRKVVLELSNVFFASDFNRDGTVNGLDANIVSNNFLLFEAGGATNADGDANGDGKVNGLDANQVSIDFLMSLPATPVPEPSTATALLIGLACSALARRRRRGS